MSDATAPRINPAVALEKANLLLRDLVDELRRMGSTLLTEDEVDELVFSPGIFLDTAEYDLPYWPTHGRTDVQERIDRTLTHVQSASRLLASADHLSISALAIPASDLMFSVRRALAETDLAWLSWTGYQHRPIRHSQSEEA